MSEDDRYKIRFDAENCIGTGRCSEVAPEFWSLNLSAGIAEPLQPTFGEEDLEENLEAAKACPAKNGKGVIRIIDRETGEEIY